MIGIRSAHFLPSASGLCGAGGWAEGGGQGERAHGSEFMGEEIDLHVGGYHLTESIGTGGMGSVFRATVEADGKPVPRGSTVAVKLLHPHLRTIPEFVQRFRREAHLAAAICHPNVVRVLDEGEDDRKHYIVMEFAPGRKLTDLLKANSPLSPQQTIEIMSQVCNALQAAHCVEDPDEPGRIRSLVHRDIKPDNIVIQDVSDRPFPTVSVADAKPSVAQLRVKLLDFGLAKDVQSLSTALSQSGQSLGTPAYMSPEQCRGEDVDQRSDIYSLGVVAYHTITGTQPFAGPTTVAYAQQHAEEIPPDILKRNPLCPNSLADCIYRCLAKDPADRYASPAELQCDLARIVRGQPVAQVHRFRRKDSFNGRRVAAIAACTLLVAAAVAVGGWMLLTDTARSDLARAMQEAEAAVAAHEYGRARSLMEDAIAAISNRSDRDQLIAPAQRRLSAIVALQEDERAKEARLARVGQLMGEARKLLVEGRLVEAGTVIRSVLELDPDSKQGLLLQNEILHRFRLAQAAPVKVQADTAVESLRAMDLARSEGFEGLLEALDATYRLAGTLFTEKDYGLAIEKYQEVIRESDRLARLEEERQQAKRELARARDAEDAALRDGAEEEPESLSALGRARKARMAGQGQFQSQRFAEAAATWQQSREGFDEAGEAASGITRLRDEAGEAKSAAVAAESAARGAGAEGLEGAVSIWSSACAKAARAEAAYKAREYATAAAEWKSAESTFIAARDLATCLSAVADARAKYQVTLSRCDQSLLCEHGAVVWEEVQQILQTATSEGKDFNEAVKAYERAASLLPQAVTEAQMVQEEARFASLLLAAQRAAEVLPPLGNALKAVEKETLESGLRAVQGALAIRPADTTAAGLKDTLESYLALPKEIQLELGNGVRIPFVLVPAGKATMGSSETEGDRKRDEGPQREVTISQPFYMGVYEVTQEQYEAVMQAKPSYFRGAKNPVDNVSWHDAVKFCREVSKKTGRTLRLPTEAEWEYAFRAGSNTRYHYGQDPDARRLGEYAWYFGNSDSKTHPVGGKKPNAFGLHDMHGNVWEWCNDRYADSYAGGKETDPTGPESGDSRVVRGGSWLSFSKDCRSASRFCLLPDTRLFNGGFRVVSLVPEEDEE